MKTRRKRNNGRLTQRLRVQNGGIPPRAKPRPAARPTSRPAARPTSRPPTRPTSRPPTRPTSRPPTRPTSRPPTRPTSRPPTRPTSRPPTRPTSRPPTRPTSRPPPTKPRSGSDANPLSKKQDRQNQELGQKHKDQKSAQSKKQSDEQKALDAKHSQEKIQGKTDMFGRKETPKQTAERQQKEKAALANKHKSEADGLQKNQAADKKKLSKKQEKEEAQLRKESAGLPDTSSAAQTGMMGSQMGSPGYGNPGYGNPGYGNPGYGSPGFNTRSQVNSGDNSINFNNGTRKNRKYNTNNNNNSSNNNNNNSSNNNNNNNSSNSRSTSLRSNGSRATSGRSNGSRGTSFRGNGSRGTTSQTNTSTSYTTLNKRGIMSVKEGIVKGTVVPGVPLEIEYEDYSGPSKPFVYKIPLEKDGSSGMLITQFLAATPKGTRFYLLYGTTIPQIEKVIKDFAAYEREVDSPKGEFVSALRDSIRDTKTDLEKLGAQKEKLLKELDDLQPDERPRYAQVLQVIEGRRKSLEDALEASIRVRNSGVK